MTKVTFHYEISLCDAQDVCQVATESLSALRTVHAFNALAQEEKKFNDRVANILILARKEAIASGIFFGSTGWSGNVTLLGLLGYGARLPPYGRSNACVLIDYRRYSCFSRRNHRRRPHKFAAIYCLCREWPFNANVGHSRSL